MARRTLTNGSECFGNMGESTGYKDLSVGDLVLVKFVDGDIFRGIVVKFKNEYCVMGACGMSFDKFEFINRVLPHHLITNEILFHLHNLSIIEPKRMTLEELEEKLGYSIEIVEGE